MHRINRFHPERSRLAPLSCTEYRPREANAIADLAGQASSHLLSCHTNGDPLPPLPFEIDTGPPYEFLLSLNASILGHHYGGKVVLALQPIGRISSPPRGTNIFCCGNMLKPYLCRYLSSRLASGVMHHQRYGYMTDFGLVVGSQMKLSGVLNIMLLLHSFQALTLLSHSCVLKSVYGFQLADR